MEDLKSLLNLVDLGKAVWAIGGAVSTSVVAVLGWLIFGPRYKQRIAVLEARPALSQTFHYNAAPAGDAFRAMEEAMGQETLRGLEETMRGLVQEPLEGGHTFARLPHGTNIVSMANGEYRLALPIVLKLEEHIIMAEGSAELTVTPPDEKSEEK